MSNIMINPSGPFDPPDDLFPPFPFPVPFPPVPLPDPLPPVPIPEPLAGTSDNDTLFGDSGDDLIYGLEGSDSINGGSGTDLISGGKGDDTISGEEDSDVKIKLTFKFESVEKTNPDGSEEKRTTIEVETEADVNAFSKLLNKLKDLVDQFKDFFTNSRSQLNRSQNSSDIEDEIQSAITQIEIEINNGTSRV